MTNLDTAIIKVERVYHCTEAADNHGFVTEIIAPTAELAMDKYATLILDNLDAYNAWEDGVLPYVDTKCIAKHDDTDRTYRRVYFFVDRP